MKEIVEEKFQIFDRYTHTHTQRGISQTVRLLLVAVSILVWNVNIWSRYMYKSTFRSWERDEIRRKSKWGSNLCMRHNAQ